MAYEVLARKWRPQNFDDVIGQEHVTQTLRNAVKSDRIAHAYLLVGPRGIGKTSIARIFAKALNCTKKKGPEPCGKCDSCVEIARGTSMDVVEIDGASNNGVDQIRDLRETVKYAPTNKFKIYIIDEVHMLSTPAFNALLKTLEEPPPFVKFIFATTEPQKILPTIISRCQRFDLRRIPVKMIVDRLNLIAKTEKVEISDDALLAIARGAEGGLRDAESALDQLISFRGNEIKEDDVLSVFGLVSRGMLESMAEHMLNGDVKALIKGVSELDESGKDLQRVLMELMDHFRNLLVYLNVDGDASGLDFAETQLEVLKKQAGKTNTARLLRICGILSQADDKMKYALSRRTVLEMALVRSARAAVVVSLEEILLQINELKDQIGAGGSMTEDASAVDVPKRQMQMKVMDAPHVQYADTANDGIESDASSGDSDELHAELPKSVPAEGGADLEKLRGKWSEILEKSAKTVPLIKSVLADAMPVAVSGGKVVIGFDPEFADDAIKNFDSGRNRKALELTLKAVLGRKVIVDAVAHAGVAMRNSIKSSGEEKATEPDSIDSGVADNVEEPKPELKTKKNIQEWVREPSVNKTLEMFNGTIVDVRE